VLLHVDLTLFTNTFINCIIKKSTKVAKVVYMSRGTFFSVFFILALIDFLVPFYLIGDVASFAASYLFWCLLTLTVIISGSIYIKTTWGRSE